MALTKITGQVINDTTGLVVGVTTVGGGLSATDGFFSGIVTAVGNASFSGSVSVGGTLTYEDVTNIDAVGLVTARNGIVVGSGITLSKDGDGFFTGVVTATSYRGDGSNLTGVSADVVDDTTPQLGGNLDTNDKNIVFGDSDGGSGTDNRAVFGAGSDLSIYHDGSHSYISEQGTGNLRILTSSVFTVNNAANSENMILATDSGAVELYYDGLKTLETKINQSSSGAGVIINNPSGSGNRVLDVKHTSGDYCFISWSDQNTTDTGTVRIGALANEMLFYGGGNASQKIDSNGHFVPGTNNTYDLGSSSVRWRNVYTNDLNLSNEGNKNDVDGTWGNYTIQEGEDDLFLINRRSGKKYKFNLTEVS